MDRPLLKRRLYSCLVFVLVAALLLTYVPAMASSLKWITPPFMLALGLLFAFLVGTPCAAFNAKASKKLLQWSVVGLGFGMNLQESLASGASGMGFTIVSVFGTLILSMWIGVRLMWIDRKTAYLVGSGTAICGGSAIAAVGPTIKADERAMSLALGTVFVLNAVGLFVFPIIGHWLEMGQHAFGTWAAIAIHDTSSVVGAAAVYGEDALHTATLIKLTRALWIIPVALVSSFIFKSKGSKINIPWFIFFFILAMIVRTYVLVDYPQIGDFISGLARKGMVLTMFFIGASLSREALRSMGIKPFLLGVALWIIISLTSLAVVMQLSPIL